MSALGDLTFEVLDGSVERYAAVPAFNLKLRITEAGGAGIHAIALRCQVRIETQRRHYSDLEAERLMELYGEISRWGDTLKPLHFANLSQIVPRFDGSIEVDLAVPCTYDFEVAAAKYFHALDDGEVPLLLLFSGTVFAKTETGFAVTPVPWHKEASYRLPVRVWREVMDLYFPNSGWIRLGRDTLDALQRFKARRAMTTWDQTLEALIEAGEREDPSLGSSGLPREGR